MELLEKKLSCQQQEILRYLTAQADYIENNYPDDYKIFYRVWGVPWQPGKLGNAWNNNDSASISRSLKRLEERGLLLRKNDITGRNRSTHVILTDKGREIGLRLILELEKFRETVNKNKM